jgi:hypothetical protein
MSCSGRNPIRAGARATFHLRCRIEEILQGRPEVRGALIGLIGGAPGAALGAMSGLTGDAVMEALDSDVVDSVTQEMRPGMTAIVVEADKKTRVLLMRS